MKFNYLLRIRVLALIIVLFSSVVFARLFFIQMVNGKEFSIMAEKQYVRPLKIFSRGTVFFKE